MSDSAHGSPPEPENDPQTEPKLPAAVEDTETYRTEDGTVFYDAENPLAWIQTDAPMALSEWA